MAELIEDSPHEEWKPVVGYEGLYEVSDAGRVRSLTRMETSTHWRTGTIVQRRRDGRVLKPALDTGGYPYVNLYRMNRGGSKYGEIAQIQRLVLEAFVGPRPDGMQACHNNGEQLDATLSNLRWDTREANMVDQVRHRRGVGRAARPIYVHGLSSAVIEALEAHAQKTLRGRRKGKGRGKSEVVRQILEAWALKQQAQCRPRSKAPAIQSESAPKHTERVLPFMG